MSNSYPQLTPWQDVRLDRIDTVSWTGCRYQANNYVQKNEVRVLQPVTEPIVAFAVRREILSNHERDRNLASGARREDLVYNHSRHILSCVTMVSPCRRHHRRECADCVEKLGVNIRPSDFGQQ